MRPTVKVLLVLRTCIARETAEGPKSPLCSSWKNWLGCPLYCSASRDAIHYLSKTRPSAENLSLEGLMPHPRAAASAGPRAGFEMLGTERVLDLLQTQTGLELTHSASLFAFGRTCRNLKRMFFTFFLLSC